MLPMMIISTPSTFPIFAAVDESAAIAIRKVLLAEHLFQRGPLDHQYFPSLTSFITSKSEMPLPTSWLVPKMACTEFITVPYSKLITATRFFGPCGLWRCGRRRRGRRLLRQTRGTQKQNRTNCDEASRHGLGLLYGNFRCGPLGMRHSITNMLGLGAL